MRRSLPSSVLDPGKQTCWSTCLNALETQAHTCLGRKCLNKQLDVYKPHASRWERKSVAGSCFAFQNATILWSRKRVFEKYLGTKEQEKGKKGSSDSGQTPHHLPKKRLQTTGKLVPLGRRSLHMSAVTSLQRLSVMNAL